MMCSSHDDYLLNNYMYPLQEKKNVVLSMVRLAAAFLRGRGAYIQGSPRKCVFLKSTATPAF